MTETAPKKAPDDDGFWWFVGAIRMVVRLFVVSLLLVSLFAYLFSGTGTNKRSLHQIRSGYKSPSYQINRGNITLRQEALGTLRLDESYGRGTRSITDTYSRIHSNRDAKKQPGDGVFHRAWDIHRFGDDGFRIERGYNDPYRVRPESMNPQSQNKE